MTDRLTSSIEWLEKLHSHFSILAYFEFESTVDRDVVERTIRSAIDDYQRFRAEDGSGDRAHGDRLARELAEFLSA